MAEQAWVEFEKMFDQLAGSTEEEDEDGSWSCQEKKGQLRNPFFLVKLRQVSTFFHLCMKSLNVFWQQLPTKHHLVVADQLYFFNNIFCIL